MRYRITSTWATSDFNWDTDLMWLAVLFASWGFHVVDTTDNSEVT